jgi:hypothetical protein
MPSGSCLGRVPSASKPKPGLEAVESGGVAELGKLRVSAGTGDVNIKQGEPVRDDQWLSSYLRINGECRSLESSLNKWPR